MTRVDSVTSEDENDDEDTAGESPLPSSVTRLPVLPLRKQSY